MMFSISLSTPSSYNSIISNHFTVRCKQELFISQMPARCDEWPEPSGPNQRPLRLECERHLSAKIQSPTSVSLEKCCRSGPNATHVALIIAVLNCMQGNIANQCYFSVKVDKLSLRSLGDTKKGKRMSIPNNYFDRTLQPGFEQNKRVPSGVLLLIFPRRKLTFMQQKQLSFQLCNLSLLAVFRVTQSCTFCSSGIRHAICLPLNSWHNIYTAFLSSGGIKTEICSPKTHCSSHQPAVETGSLIAERSSTQWLDQCCLFVSP